MQAFPRPVTNTKCSMPAARASLTTCWITGRSTTVSISLGTALVAGRKRVPSPATGNTALRIRFGLDIGTPWFLGRADRSIRSREGARRLYPKLRHEYANLSGKGLTGAGKVRKE